MSTNTILASAPLTSTGYHLKANGTTLGNSLIWDNGTNVGIGNTNTSYTLDVSGSGRYNGSYAGHLLNVQNTNASYYSSTDYYDNAGTEKLIVGYGNASTGNALASKAIIYGTSGVGLNFYTNGSTTAKMVIDTSGDVSIGTTSTNANTKVKIKASSEGSTIGLSSSTLCIARSATDTFLSIGYYSTPDAFLISASYGADGAYKPIAFATSDVERMRITSGGNVGINANGTNAQLDIKSSTNSNPVIYGYNTSSAPYGMRIIYSTTPNNSDNWFLYADDSTGQRFSVRSNGGVYNYTGNNVPLSDQRMKKEIAPLESYWDKFKSIEMVKFKYIDQTHDDFNIGVVSQQIESIMPEFVDVWDEKNIPEDGKPLMGVYMEDIHNIAMKVLQEAMTKIEEQQIQIQNLQEQINILAK